MLEPADGRGDHRRLPDVHSAGDQGQRADPAAAEPPDGCRQRVIRVYPGTDTDTDTGTGTGTETGTGRVESAGVAFHLGESVQDDLVVTAPATARDPHIPRGA